MDRLGTSNPVSHIAHTMAMRKGKRKRRPVVRALKAVADLQAAPVEPETAADSSSAVSPETPATEQQSTERMNPCACQPPRRGYAAQQPRREAERDVRRRALDFQRWAQERGLRQRNAARQLGVAPGTLAFWDYRWDADRLEARPLGRPRTAES